MAKKTEPNSGWGLYVHFMPLLHKRKETIYYTPECPTLLKAK